MTSLKPFWWAWFMVDRSKQWCRNCTVQTSRGCSWFVRCIWFERQILSIGAAIIIYGLFSVHVGSQTPVPLAIQAAIPVPSGRKLSSWLQNWHRITHKSSRIFSAVWKMSIWTKLFPISKINSSIAFWMIMTIIRKSRRNNHPAAVCSFWMTAVSFFVILLKKEKKKTF